MKTSEGISFSIAHLSPLKQLRCKYGQELLRFVDDKTHKLTYRLGRFFPIESMDCESQDAVVMVTCDLFLILIGSEK